jgi:hypothetical protein
MATIITKNSSTSSATPAAGDLTKGELAVNVTDKKLYTKDNSATVVRIVGSLGNQEASAAAITGGTVAGVAQTGGTINNTPIGGTTAAAVTGTVVTATTNFVGALTGAVTGNTTGTHTGDVTGNVTGNLTGNVTASTGTSSFNDVTINGGLNMNAGTSATITNLTSPTNSGDAATKGYVDTAISNLVDGAPAALDTLNELAAALNDDASFSTTVTNSIAAKLPLAGGTMTGAIAMGTSKITGLGTPTANTDAATKGYVDTSAAGGLPLSGGTMTGNIVMGANKVTSTATPSDNSDLTTKLYVDGILGSATAAATSASNAATSETNAGNSASAASSSASAASASASSAAASYDSFDDRYLGPKSSAPSVDNDGNTLLTGALYWNTTSSNLFIWSGSAWTSAAFTAGGFATLTGTETLTNKTLTAPVLTSPNITTALTLAGASGSSGQVLTSGGSGNAPTWASAASSSYRSILNQSSNITLVSTDGGGFINVSGTTDLNLNLPAANALTNRTIYIKNVGNFVMFTYDNAGNYLFTLNPDVTVACWASDNSSVAGQWTVQEAPPPYVAPTSNIASVAIEYALGIDPVSKISSTQQILVYNKQTTLEQNPYAVIVTQSSGVLSYGTPYLIANEAGESVTVTMTSATTGVVTWVSTGVGLRGCVITVSGTTITAGTPITIYSASTFYGYNQTDALSATTLIATANVTSSSLRAWVLTISGTTLSTGTSVEVANGISGDPTFLGALSSSLAIATYVDNSAVVLARTLSISGSTITLNTSVTVEASIGGGTHVSGCVLSATKVAVIYNNPNTANYEIRCINISGTALTVATKQTLSAGGSAQGTIGAISNTTGIVLYVDNTGVWRYKGWTLVTNTFTLGTASSAPSSFSSYVYPNLVGFAAPAVGTPSTSTYMLTKVYINGTNLQTLTLSGTTVTQNSLEFANPTYFSISANTTINGICALSTTKSIVLVGNYVAGGLASGLNAFLIDNSASTPSLAQSLNLANNFLGNYSSITAISSTQAIVVYVDTANQLKAAVITLSGSTISVGSIATVTTVNTTWHDISNLSSTSAILCWMETSAFKSVILTVSGSTVTVNSTVTINTATATEIQVASLSSTKALVTYAQSGSKANVLTISGTSITVGTQQPLNVSNQNRQSLIAISATKCLHGCGATSSGSSHGSVLSISGDIVTAGYTTSLLNISQGIIFAPTSLNKGIALLRGGSLVYSYTIANDIINFSNSTSTVGYYIYTLAAPNVATPSGNKIEVFGSDGANLLPNHIFASGAIN